MGSLDAKPETNQNQNPITPNKLEKDDTFLTNRPEVEQLPS